MKPYYRDETITIYHGDCAEILPTLPVADLLLTDPPYGIGENNEKNLSRGNKAKPKDYGKFDWDKEAVSDDLIKLVLGSARRLIVWGGNYYSHLLNPSACWLVWDKLNGTNDFADAELAWTNLPQAVRLKKHLWNGMLRKGQEERFHPTQKPLSVMHWCIMQADKHGENNLIIDPFMGSGTTLRAAKDLKRKAIGIDKEERYCDITVKRLRQEVLL